MDRELAVVLAEHEDGPGDPSVSDVVESIPAFDESALPDPFAKRPPWAVG